VTTIGFIGLGVMGAPMARNLLAAGHVVTAHNRSPGKVAEFVAAGGRGAETVAEAMTGAEIVITMLPDSPDVTAVMAGPDGVIANAPAGALVIDMSTIRPDVARGLAAQATAAGLRFLDAPASGGEAAAVDGNLSVMVGGETADLAAARPVLEVLGATIVHVGPAGSGQTVKAANQLIVAGNLELLAEALTFLDAHGVDLSAALQVLGGGLAGSTVLQRKGPAMLGREFSPGFRLALHHKDLSIFTDAARESNVVAPLGALVASLVASMTAQNLGHLDHCALLLLVEQLSGRQPADHAKES